MSIVNFYSGATLDRCSESRTDIKYFAETISKKETKYIVFQNCRPLFKGSNDDVKRILVLTYEDVKTFVDFNVINGDKWPPNLLYLGKDKENCDWFSMNIEEDGVLNSLLIEDRFLANGRIQGLQLSWDDSSIVAQAQAMFHWHDRYRFCPTCGAKMFVEEAGYKRTCVVKECRSNKGIHNTCYPRTDPVVIMMIISKDGEKCLLGRKDTWPKKMYSCLAGFMEPGETIEEAVKRETKEESGICVENVRYITSQPWPYPSCLMIGCQATATTEEIRVNTEELADAKWFHVDVVRDACEEKTKREMSVPPLQTIAGQLMRQWVFKSEDSVTNKSSL